MSDRLDVVVSRLREARAKCPEPSLETLQAYAEGQLGLGGMRVLALRPELLDELEVLRNPDPGLDAAILRGIAAAKRELYPPPPIWSGILGWFLVGFGLVGIGFILGVALGS